MVTIAAAVLLVGYSLFYVAASNLAHGPGKGVGFTEVIGLGGPTAAPAPSTSTPSSPASTQSRTSTPAKPKPGNPTSSP